MHILVLRLSRHGRPLAHWRWELFSLRHTPLAGGDGFATRLEALLAAEKWADVNFPGDRSIEIRPALSEGN